MNIIAQSRRVIKVVAVVAPSIGPEKQSDRCRAVMNVRSNCKLLKCHPRISQAGNEFKFVVCAWDWELEAVSWVAVLVAYWIAWRKILFLWWEEMRFAEIIKIRNAIDLPMFELGESCLSRLTVTVGCSHQAAVRSTLRRIGPDG